MAHFAELDINNKVLRVNVACNVDIQNNGGEQSEQAAEHFKTVSPLSENGVKWIQTSYNNNFRKQYAGIGHSYDPVKDIFICPQPYPSWSLNSTGDWMPPIPYPSVYFYGDKIPYRIIWNESEQKFTAFDKEGNEFLWIPSSLSWVATGN